MKKIVVVDDQPMVGNIYRSKFLAEGFQVHVAADGEHGIEVIQREKPDLVILDFQLPKMDGLQVLRKLRADAPFARLPIILFSGSGRPGFVEEAWSAGATNVLSKTSTSPKQMVELVRGILASQQVAGTAGVSSDDAPQTETKATIVHFDPNPDLRALISLILRRAGYLIIPAQSDNDALELVANTHADLFLINGVSGSCISLIQQISSQFADRPMIAYSIAAPLAQRTAVLHAGASLFISTPEELLDIVDSLKKLITVRRQIAA